MGTITGYTAAHMAAIEAACIVAGAVDLSGHLQLTRHDGSSFDAGSVIGPAGPSTSVPPGTMLRFGGVGTPAGGFLLCDGSSYLRTDYPALFAVIGTKYGSIDASHFNVPDNGGWRGISTDTTSILNSTFTKLSGWSSDTASGYTSKNGKYYNYTPGTFTMVTPGEYDIFAQNTWAADASGGRFLLTIRKNGTEMVRSDITMGTRSVPKALNLSKSFMIAANDTIEVWIFQTTGATISLGSSPAHIIELKPKGIGDIIKY